MSEVSRPEELDKFEWRVVRLLRCLTWSERDEIAQRVARAVLDSAPERFSVEPDGNVAANSEDGAQCTDPDRYEDFLLECFWKVNTASPEIDAMRDYDDPFWECFGEPIEWVLFGATSPAGWAEALAEHYLAFCHHHALPIPSEFADSDDPVDDGKWFRQQFGAFIEEWRERVVEEIEARLENLPRKKGSGE